ncbi:manganese ABC transporter ATP-binding protein [Streptococcus penaeicida]|uniref:Manganese ABC transporter ATP-binding protein n=1 Tax=Streptococcus penaeicida TaxID=1765960 RepID=A0A2N8LBG6_9STRE|nr:metal ABC transporter ATP-binding protein [Streptococcus penaeicida]PND47496.1 manganese ABC transporter ATP-binding protein [Streptococcus penaeicida]
MIRTKDLSVSYDGCNKILDKVNLSIDETGIIGIIGPNGAGKSTLMKAMLGLIPYKGELAIDNDSQQISQQVAYVEQRSQFDLQFPITVEECVLLGTYGRLGLFHVATTNERALAARYLQEVGLEDYSQKPIKALSGGQFQRMLLARCLIQEQNYLFLDEPFVGIDSVSEAIIVSLLKKLANQGKTILIVHHDLSKVKDYFDQLLLLNRGLIAFGPVEEVFNQANLTKTYGENRVMTGGVI